MFAFSLSLPLLGTTARSLPILLLHASRREIVQVVWCVRASQKMSNQQKLTGPIKKKSARALQFYSPTTTAKSSRGRNSGLDGLSLLGPLC